MARLPDLTEHLNEPVTSKPLAGTESLQAHTTLLEPITVPGRAGSPEYTEPMLKALIKQAALNNQYLHTWRSWWWLWTDKTGWQTLCRINNAAIIRRWIKNAITRTRCTRCSRGGAPWPSNRFIIWSLMQELADYVSVPENFERNWAPAHHDYVDHNPPIGASDHASVITTQTQNVVHDNGTVVNVQDATPHWWDPYPLDTVYDAAAVAPRWERWLQETFAHDPGQVRTLQQWFGYVISGRTDLQKFLVISGPPGSGKGTIMRVLTKLVGQQRTTASTLSSIVKDTGLADYGTATLATFSDVKFRHYDLRAVEIILSITGEDHIRVNRKNVDAVTVQSPVRIMMCSNNAPRFGDTNEAIRGRILLLDTKIGYRDTEDMDITLGAQFESELAGILNWALAGVPDDDGIHVTEYMQKQTDLIMKRSMHPITAFVRETYELTGNHRDRLDRDGFREKYIQWCKNHEVDVESPRMVNIVLSELGVMVRNRSGQDLHANGEGNKTIRAYGGLVEKLWYSWY